jgi:hypothetical protein
MRKPVGAIVKHIDRETSKSNHFSEAVDNPRNVVEAVAELGPSRHVRLAKPGQVGRNNTKPVRELWNEIAEHMTGARKTVQQEEYRCVLRPRLAIEDVEPVDVDLPEADLAHCQAFS